MFTGIVEELGEVEAVEELGDFARIHVASVAVAADARPGDSIAVNGVCLTVTTLITGPPGAASREPDASQPAAGMSDRLAASSGMPRGVRGVAPPGGAGMSDRLAGSSGMPRGVRGVAPPGGASMSDRLAGPSGMPRGVRGVAPPGGAGAAGTGGVPRGFTADVMGETLARSSLASARPGARVNLERSVRMGDRLGGHLVQGHVDGTAAVISRSRQGSDGARWEVVRIGLPAHLERYVAHKGSIAVDGVSLTVSAVADPAGRPGWFEVSLIPETLTRTTLGLRAPGDLVNLEADAVAKHIERLMLSSGVPAAAGGAGGAACEPGPGGQAGLRGTPGETTTGGTR
jgi:riboflavin synthase